MLDRELLKDIYARMGQDGWNTKKVPFRVQTGGHIPAPGETNARYLQVVWALEQIQEWGAAVRCGRPMRRIPEREPRAVLRDWSVTKP